ncbi:phage holin family protein [Vibrio crassostreae]|uniref:phage holin family protein n=1 Tax=Vibrio crassostreae TaxID=246167 RepID=UPI001B300B2F|nr:phage holin family protein [Vibrio crassostreae]
MPEKDPQNYSVLSYLVFGLLAVWGGLVTHIQHIRRHKKPFLWKEAVMQIAISGFAGMLASFLCWYIEAPVPLAGFVAGTAGFMGSRALDIYERKVSKIFDENGG